MADIYKRDTAYAHTSVDGDLQTIGGTDNLRAALLRRWITEPGTFAYRPEYGAGLLKFENEIMTADVQRQMAKLIEEQTKMEKRVEAVNTISFSFDDDTPSRMMIMVKVKPIGHTEITINYLLGD